MGKVLVFVTMLRDGGTSKSGTDEILYRVEIRDFYAHSDQEKYNRNFLLSAAVVM